MRTTLIAVFWVVSALLSFGAMAADPAATSEDKRIPFRETGERDTGVPVLRVVLGLAMVLAIGAGTIVLMKRYLPAAYGGAGPGGTARHIDVVEIRRLTPRLTLFLVDAAGERILFAESGGQTTVLARSAVPAKSLGPT